MRFSLLIFVLFSFYSCTKDTDSPQKKLVKTEGSPKLIKNITHLKLLSYNLALAKGYVPFVEERFKKIVDILKTTDTNVLCLQEVWEESHKKKIKDELKEIFPYSFSSPKREDPRRRGWFSGPACYITDLLGNGKFLTCLLNECSEGSKSERNYCLKVKCRPALDKLVKKNRVCAEGLVSSVGQNKLAPIKLLTPLKWLIDFSIKALAVS